jgi:hypothetical protein
MDVVPRVSADVLARALGHQAGMVTVFTTHGRPFQVNESQLSSLERRSLAKLEVEEVAVLDLSAEPAAEAQIINDAVGRFALWGFPDAPDRKLLPPGK